MRHWSSDATHGGAIWLHLAPPFAYEPLILLAASIPPFWWHPFSRMAERSVVCLPGLGLDPKNPKNWPTSLGNQMKGWNWPCSKPCPCPWPNGLMDLPNGVQYGCNASIFIAGLPHFALVALCSARIFSNFVIAAGCDQHTSQNGTLEPRTRASNKR